MRTAFAILFFLFCSVLSKAQVQQSIMFEKTWGPQLGDYMFYADELPNGNINLFGCHGSWGVNTAHIYMCQIDKQGNLLWEKEFGYVDGQYGVGTVIKTKAGNYLVTGTIEFSGKDVCVFLVDKTGEIIFENYFNGGMYDYGGPACETEDSCYMLSVDLNLPNGHVSPTLIKIDAQGNEIWRKRQDGHPDHYPMFIRILTGGGYIVTGLAGNNATTYTARYQSNGDLDWIIYPYGASSSFWNMPSCLFVNPDNSFSIPIKRYNDTLEHTQTFWKEFDANGVFIGERLYDLRLDFLYVSNTNYPSVDPIDSSLILTTPPYDYSENWIFKLDENKDLQFQTKLTNDTTYKSIYYSIRTMDGGFLSVGVNSPPNSGGYYYVVKFGADGRYQPEDFSGTVTAYPNPSADGNITLGFDMKNDETVHVRILSADGKLVYTDELFCPANSQTILPVRLDESSANGGMYILEATTSTATYRRKLIVMREH